MDLWIMFADEIACYCVYTCIHPPAVHSNSVYYIVAVLRN